MLLKKYVNYVFRLPSEISFFRMPLNKSIKKYNLFGNLFKIYVTKKGNLDYTQWVVIAIYQLPVTIQNASSVQSFWIL